MQRHAQIGHDILAYSGSPLLDLAADIAVTHHEHFNGNGYPAGLPGEKILLAGRIVAIVDVFDALISDGPYRARLPLERIVLTVAVCEQVVDEAESVCRTCRPTEANVVLRFGRLIGEHIELAKK